MVRLSFHVFQEHIIPNFSEAFDKKSGFQIQISTFSVLQNNNKKKQ